MKKEIDYRKSSPEVVKAWFEYKRAAASSPTAPVVASFVAGWAAARAEFDEFCHFFRVDQRATLNKESADDLDCANETGWWANQESARTVE